MRKSRKILSSVLCGLFALTSVPIAQAATIDGVKEEVTTSVPLHTHSLENVNISNSEFTSKSETPLDGSGLVLTGSAIRANILKSTFSNILSSKSGSVIHGSYFSMIESLSESEFSNNGIIADYTDENVSLGGGAIYFEQTSIQDGGSLSKSDIGQIHATKFIDNFIKTTATGKELTVDVTGGAVHSSYIAYMLGEDGTSREMGYYPEGPNINFANVFGGITSSEFSGNSIDVAVQKAENSRINAGGAAVSAEYVRQIADSNFVKNSLSSSIDSSGSAIGNIYGGTVATTGVSEILNSNFNENIVSQDVHGDYASGIVAGGVIASNAFNTSVISNSKFDKNTISSAVSGSKTSETQVSGGVMYNSNTINKITDASFSKNKVTSKANSANSQTNILGGILNSNGIDLISNSTFSNNSINVSGQNLNFDGGVVFSANTLPEVTNVTFADNKTNINLAGDGTISSVLGGVVSARQNFSDVSAEDGVMLADDSLIGDMDFGMPIAPVGPVSATSVTDESIEKILDSSFENNELNVTTSASNSSLNVDGGVVKSTIIVRNIENTKFNNNKVNVNSSGNGAIVSMNGGVLSTPYSAKIDKATFKGNSAIISSTGSNSYLDARGGAVLVSDDLTELTNSEFSSNKLSVSASGETPMGVMAQGGAIYTGNIGTLKNNKFNSNEVSAVGANAIAKGGAMYIAGDTTTISDSSFDSNKAIAEGEGSQALGGAIYNDNYGSLTITDSSFTNNSATTKGGAIYSNGALSLIADKVDIIFSGNTAQTGADIYVNDSSVDLITNSVDRKIAINGGIGLGSTGMIPSINAKGQGTLELNAPITYDGDSYGEFNIQDSVKVKPLSDDSINNAKLKISMDGTSSLDLMNGKGTKIEVYDLDIKSDTTSMNVDLNLDGSQSDYFNINSATPSNTGKINLSKVNILSDSTVKNQKIKIASSSNEVIANSVNYTNKNKYVITQDATEKDKLSILRENDTDIDGFAQAVINSSDTTFSAIDNVVTDLSVNGNQLANNLTVYGNNKSIDFSGTQAINIANSKTLNLENVSELKNTGSDSIKVGQNATLNINSNTTDTTIDTALTLADSTSKVNVNLALGDNNKQNALLATAADEDVNVNISSGRSAIFKKKISGTAASKGLVNVSGGSVGFDELENVQLAANRTNATFNNKMNSSVLSLNNSVANLYGESEQVTLNVQKSVLGVNNIYANGALNSTESTLNIANDSYLDGSDLAMNASTMSLVNDNIGTMNLKSLALTGKNDISVDVDLNSLTADKINPESVNVSDGGSLNISNFNVTKNSIATAGTVSVTDNEELKQHITTSVGNIDNGLYSYAVGRTDARDYSFNVTRYDPAVQVGSVAQQAMFLTQVNAYNQAFAGMDMYMARPYGERMALRYNDMLALEDGETGKYALNHRRDYDKGFFLRPYGSIERVKLKKGPKVDNYTYGSFVGFDSNLVHMKSGFDAVYSGYVSYNGSIQDYDSVKIHQNGATVGATAAFYKKNFFTGLTLNGSIGVADADTSHGSEDFTMLAAGVASKTGYNFETHDGGFVFQPSLLASYSYIDTESYTNSSGLRINSDGLNAVQLEPGVKFIFNCENKWQPYLAASVVFNILDKTKFSAASVAIPRMSINPYGQYRLGVQKRWGERSLGFAQTTVRSGGRPGAELQFGFRWSI